MKNLILIIIGLVAGIILYQRVSNDSMTEEPSPQNSEIIHVKGRVDSNISIIGRSAYKLTDVEDTTTSYHVLVEGEAPSIGDIREVYLSKYDLLVLNDRSVTVYLEQPKRNWLGF